VIRLMALCCLIGCAGIGDAQKRVRTAVDAKQPTLTECYGATLALNEKASGSMLVSLRVTESSGRVDAVAIKQSSIPDDKLQECVKSALVGIQIAPGPKANLDIDYTLTFAPG
jgi:hypothetical protein